MKLTTTWVFQKLSWSTTIGFFCWKKWKQNNFGDHFGGSGGYAGDMQQFQFIIDGDIWDKGQMEPLMLFKSLSFLKTSLCLKVGAKLFHCRSFHTSRREKKRVPSAKSDITPLKVDLLSSSLERKHLSKKEKRNNIQNWRMKSWITRGPRKTSLIFG